ncbi:MAG: methylthioribose kinase [Bacillus sp. (in: firmicutes)]
MIQRFIELGEGYSDLYELIEIGRTNKERVAFLLALHTKKNDKELVSLAVVLKPTNPGDFQPIYICREGIPNPHVIPNKRYDMFQALAKEIEKNIIELDVKPSTLFSETELFYQHLIGILRMNRYLPPLS